MVATNPPKVQLEPPTVSIRPGAPALVQVRVVNMSSIVDTFEVGLVGQSLVGLTCATQEVKLLKNSEKTVQLSIVTSVQDPPPAGDRVIGVRVQSRADRSLVRVEELSIAVPAVGQPTLTIEPAMVRGADSAILRARLANKTNRALNLGFSGSDAEHRMAMAFEPNAVFLTPGETADVMVRVKGKQPLTGTDVTTALQINAGDGADRLTGAATFIQSPRFSAGLLRVVGGTLAVLLLVGAMFGGPIIASMISGSDSNVGVEAGSGGAVVPEDLPPAPEVAGSQQVQVPAVTGLDIASATALISGSQLVVGTVESEQNSLPAGSIVASDPAPGTAVDPFSPVNLSVSSGEVEIVQVAIPDVLNRTFPEAEAILSSACESQPCLLASEVNEFDTAVRGAVIGTNPAIGSDADPGQSVQVIVSLGPEPAEQPESAISPVKGTWTNQTPANSPLERLIFEDVGGTPFVTAISATGQTNLGRVKGTFDGTAGKASFVEGFTTHAVEYRLQGGTLLVTTRSTFNSFLIPLIVPFPLPPLVTLPEGAQLTTTPTTRPPVTQATIPPVTSPPPVATFTQEDG